MRRGGGTAPYTAAMKRAHDPLRLDVAAFTAEAGTLQGQWPADTLSRLADSQSAPQDTALNPVDWHVTGSRVPVPGGEEALWLTLQADTSVWLSCQRCLQPMAEPLSLDHRIRFVRGESQAEALDAELEDDVLALPRSLDLRELIEDELLLALPLVPRHTVCPQPLPMSVGEEALAADDSADKHPFAALQALKRGGGGVGGAQ